MVRVALRVEGLAIFCLATYGYVAAGGRWLWFVVLFLTPDLSMIGYVANPAAGSITYNLAHTYVTAAVAVGIGWVFVVPWLTLGGLLLAAHIGLDRALGYGLKYPTGFRTTHLDRT